jgi:hypothetical protein
MGPNENSQGEAARIKRGRRGGLTVHGQLQYMSVE